MRERRAQGGREATGQAVDRCIGCASERSSEGQEAGAAAHERRRPEEKRGRKRTLSGGEIIAAQRAAQHAAQHAA